MPAMKMHQDYDILETAISAEAMRPHLEPVVHAIWGDDAVIRNFFVPRVLPRPDGKVLVQYHADLDRPGMTDTQAVILYGEHFPSPVPLPEDGTRTDERTLWLDDLRLRVWKFPHDPKLNRLSVLFDARQFAGTFADQLENVGLGQAGTAQVTDLLGYRVGRRCTVRIRWDDTDAEGENRRTREVIVKMSRSKQALTQWGKLKQLELAGFDSAAADGIVLPKHLFFHRSTGTIFQRLEPGQSLHSLIGRPEFVTGCHTSAHALKKLHRVRLSGLAFYGPSDDLRLVRWLTQMTGTAYPEMASRLNHALARLEHLSPTDTPDEAVTTHRDFYDKQLLFDGTRTVLLDYDTLAVADPALDYGNFVAHVEWRAHQYPQYAESILSGRNAFCESFDLPDREFAVRARWWDAATRLRLVCLYSWRPRWRERVAGLLDSLEQLPGMSPRGQEAGKV